MPDLAGQPGLIPLVLIMPLLVAVAYSDMRYLRIPNNCCLALVAIFALVSILGLVPDFAQRIALAGGVFVIGFGAYCLGLFGGGDVKFLPALLLFIPAGSMQVYGLVFSATMLIGVAGIMALKRVPALAGSDWRSLAPGRQIPMGLPMAMSGILHPFVLLHLNASG